MPSHQYLSQSPGPGPQQPSNPEDQTLFPLSDDDHDGDVHACGCLGFRGLPSPPDRILPIHFLWSFPFAALDRAISWVYQWI